MAKTCKHLWLLTGRKLLILLSFCRIRLGSCFYPINAGIELRYIFHVPNNFSSSALKLRMIFANTFSYHSYSCVHSHCDSKYGNKSGVKMGQDIYPHQKLCVHIDAYEKKAVLFSQKNPHSWERELGLSCVEPGSPLCRAHPPCCRTRFEVGVHIRKSIGMNSTFEVLWPETKGQITLPGPGLLLGPVPCTWTCPGAAGPRCTDAAKLFKASLVSDAQVLPSEWSSGVTCKVSVRPRGAPLHKQTHSVFRMDFKDFLRQTSTVS